MSRSSIIFYQRWGVLATDVGAHNKQLEVRMEVPGIEPKSLSASINGRLSEAVVADEVKARYRDGVLIVKLPKSRPSKTDRVDVTVS